MVGYAEVTRDGRLEYDFAVARFSTDGTLDTSFGGGDGWASNDSGAHDVVTDLVRIGDRFYVGSGSGYDYAIARFTSEGDVDETFGSDGIAITDLTDNDVSYAIGAHQGKVVLTGYSLKHDGSDSSLVVLRYRA